MFLSDPRVRVYVYVRALTHLLTRSRVRVYVYVRALARAFALNLFVRIAHRQVLSRARAYARGCVHICEGAALHSRIHTRSRERSECRRVCIRYESTRLYAMGV